MAMVDHAAKANPTARPRRRFTLLDGMILVAATAVGCAADGWLLSATDWRDTDDWEILGYFVQARKYVDLAAILSLLALPIATAWTLAMVPLRLIGPRPDLRRLGRQPGWVASCAFALTLPFSSLVFAILAAALKVTPADLLAEFGPLAPGLVAPAILGAWLALILGRRWTPEPTWVDRVGRALGGFWLLASAGGTALFGWAFF